MSANAASKAGLQASAVSEPATSVAHAGEVRFVDVHWQGRTDRIEHQWIHAERTDRPLVVFLHEGLGSLEMWRDFPARLCAGADCRGLVFSRVGYGRSTPRQPHERWPVTFMHAQAEAFLPAFFAAVGIGADLDNDTPSGQGPRPWLYGHSDGGSIALLHAARHPGSVAGLVVAAPHILVEDLSIASIERARDAYLSTDLRAKLGRYHADPDSAFWGWNDIWLDPAFRAWNIEPQLDDITCPVLAVQGRDDEYGSMAQIDGIAERMPQCQLLKLDDCGHSPHRDRPDAVVQAVRSLLADPPSGASPSTTSAPPGSRGAVA